MYVDIVTGEKLLSIQVANMKLVYLSVRSSIRRGCKGDEKGESLFQPAAYFFLIENMKIWCKIQVIIYPLVSQQNP